ncbi:hypothetical protein Ga0074812_102430 [Parafrankia irregularis]|uniref:Uncharacterized protein n=1 Tax=Parafrankia irregularis TaxID=795642 RepID=A0A0S4QFZ0_9ACTN|nr:MULTISPECIES: hypothetical protein [Parafrankia]MBE3202951.1 hypothetical protein [Parafrankia sp. CH37]CUU54420.1 hypothetical protein Ga0074812_102430 [Parafrankia irregularis]
MALRDGIAFQVRPYLAPGEQVQHVVLVQAGISPYFNLVPTLGLFSWNLTTNLLPWSEYYFFASGAVMAALFLACCTIYLTRVRNRILVVTNQAILLMGAGLIAWATPNGPPLLRLPRRTVLGPPRGLSGAMLLSGERLWVSPLFRKRVTAANAELAVVTSPPWPGSAIS